MGNAVRFALICDDDPMLATVASVLLRDEGFDVTTVGTAAELAAVLAARTPHIVVLDQELPDAAGDELVDGIRAAAPACRIIMFSGHEQTSGSHPAVFARVSKRGTDDLASAIQRAAAD